MFISQLIPSRWPSDRIVLIQITFHILLDLVFSLDCLGAQQWVALCKNVPNSLSRCHTKRKDGREWQKNCFLKFFFFFLKNLKSRCHTKRTMGAATCTHPSFGMITTLGTFLRDAAQLWWSLSDLHCPMPSVTQHLIHCSAWIANGYTLMDNLAQAVLRYIDTVRMGIKRYSNSVEFCGILFHLPLNYNMYEALDPIRPSMGICFPRGVPPPPGHMGWDRFEQRPLSNLPVLSKETKSDCCTMVHT